MTCVQGDHEVQTLAPHRPDYPFTDGIRHRRLHRCFEHAYPHTPDTPVNFFGKNGIPVMDENTVRLVSWDRFSELLHGPLSGRMCRHIDMNKSTTSMLDHHEHIEHVEGGGDRHAEVASQYPFGMITDKVRPARSLTPLAWSPDTMARHILTHGSRRYP